MEIYRCVQGDIDLRFASINITLHTPINLHIGLFKHQYLYNTALEEILARDGWKVGETQITQLLIKTHFS